MGSKEAGATWTVTRTHAFDPNNEFQALINAVDNAEQKMCAQVRAGFDYKQLHLDAHLSLARILQEFRLINVAPEVAVETGVSSAFFPHGIGHGIVGDLRRMASAEAQTAISLTVAIALLVYIVLMALPFCPGIEVGMALLALGGRDIAPLVYLATVVALVLAFVVGRLSPPGALVASLARLRLRRAAESQ